MKDKVLNERIGIQEMKEFLDNLSNIQRKEEHELEEEMRSFREIYKEEGLEGLGALISKEHVKRTNLSHELKDEIIQLSTQHPSWGCVRLSDYLKSKKILISSPTVQKILINNGMAGKRDRARYLEQQYLEQATQLSEEQIESIEWMNPNFKERSNEVQRPGQLLCAACVYVGTKHDQGRIYLHLIIDHYNALVFGMLHPGRKTECSAVLLHNEVLPFYRKKKLKVEEVIIGYDALTKRETDINVLGLFLDLNELSYKRNSSDGFVERFSEVIVLDFFRDKFNESVDLEQLQSELGLWIDKYNRTPQNGFPNRGSSPLQRLTSFVKSK